MSKYKQLNNGEVIRLKYVQANKIKGAGLNFRCCDCGLVHKIVVLPFKTQVKLYFWRDNRATANIRRSKK